MTGPPPPQALAILRRTYPEGSDLSHVVREIEQQIDEDNRAAKVSWSAVSPPLAISGADVCVLGIHHPRHAFPMPSCVDVCGCHRRRHRSGRGHHYRSVTNMITGVITRIYIRSGRVLLYLQ
jgi:hypothetical protein